MCANAHLFYIKFSKLTTSKSNQISMGIKQLMSLLQEKAPGCIKKIQLDSLTGYTVACDASMV